MDSAETRYAHLLQPLRDLTKNWDIDLASQLGEYLEELDQMTISFDGGKTMMNFAEAALLIQGSTCIYGRKVELLHTLVFQTLDYISNKNKKRDKQGSSDDGSQDKAAAGNEEDDCEFDEIEQNENVSSVNLTMKDITEPVKIIRLPPESLIPVESHEKQKYPLLSLKGELLGSCKDYRMNNFSMDEMGLMRLGSSHAHFLKDVSENQHNASVHAPVHLETEGEAEVAVGHDDGDDDGGDAEVLPPLEDHGMEVESEEWVERHQAPSEGRMLRPRPAIQPVSEEPKKLKEFADPWKWHDSYAAFGEDKPLKTGKCYKVPAGLEESGKRKRKGPSKLQDFGSWFSKAFETADRKLKNGPTYPDLNYIFVSKMGQRLKVQKQFLRKRGMFVSDEELKKTYLEPANVEDQIEEIRHPDAEGEDFSDNEHDNLDELGLAEPLGEPEQIFQDLHMSRMSYEDLVKKSVDLFLVNSQKYAQETALSRRVKEWEDGINPHLAAQEISPAFDIHEYGDRIVQALSNVGVKKSFAFVVKGKENTEACRYMLAALQLANDYTVQIDQRGVLEDSVDTMELTLLTTQRAHERLKTYNAPSATDTP
ncbi:condensin-2 complex subunit H2 [Misgurnus anguillicaudatus]|uniref:condensin-2 complex subunit H2 n=1 Tax=Misgurnus anguillicaudatus TaxID=75329 RepID=UPI003CCF12D1